MSVTPLLQPPWYETNWLKADRGALLRYALELVAMVAREVRVRRDMKRLADFDDFMLRDIGLDRTQIEQAVRWGRPGILPGRGDFDAGVWPPRT